MHRLIAVGILHGEAEGDGAGAKAELGATGGVGAAAREGLPLGADTQGAGDAGDYWGRALLA